MLIGAAIFLLVVVFSSTVLAIGNAPQADKVVSAQKPTTPTPPAPRSPFELPPVDPYTVALYRFDSAEGNIVPDEVGLHPATLVGNAGITPTGIFNGALYVDGNAAYARTGYLGPLPSGTIEAFVDFTTACGPFNQARYSTISAGGEYGSNQPAMIVRTDGYLNMEIVIGGGIQMATSGVNPCRYFQGGNTSPYFYPTPVAWPYEKWRYHHIAGTWGPRGLEVWLDGVLHGVGNNTISTDHYNLNYACNPQMQLGSTLYPRCQTPVIGLVPGGFAGGLPNYSTFLIGCDQQYRCFNGRIDEVRISNIQRTFSPIFDPTPTPIASPTPSPTPTPSAPYPDMTISAIAPPIWSDHAMTQTISVIVTNRGNVNFNSPVRPAQAPIVGQQSGTRREIPAIARAPDYSGTTNYFFYVDVYVDDRPFGVLEPGNCPTFGGGTNWSWVYNLGLGQSVTVPIDCWINQGIHTFYAQVDVCDDGSGNLCSTTYGYVLEINEDNNIYPLGGQLRSASPFDFLPSIFRRP